MLLKRVPGRNYFVALFILLAITIPVVFSAFAVSALVPEALGKKPVTYSVAAIYEFEPWAFEIDTLDVFFPKGGTIIYLGEMERQGSYLLQGSGVFYHDGSQLPAEDSGGLFMVIEQSLFEEKRKDNLFIPVESRAQASRAQEVVGKQVGIPIIWESIVPLTFNPQEQLSYYYFIDPDGEPLLPPYTAENQRSLYGAFLFYSLVMAIILLVMTIFLLDRRYSKIWVLLKSSDPGYFSLVLAILLAGLAVTGEILVEAHGWEDYYRLLGYGIALTLILVAYRLKMIDYINLGLHRERIKDGYPFALITALLLIGITGGIPSGIQFGGIEMVRAFVTVLLFTAFPAELVWRGYILTYLSRKFSPALGLIITMVLSGGASYLIVTGGTPWIAQYPYSYIEHVILAPGMAAILGYLYLKTENILASTLLHGLVLFLPGIILYQ